MRATWIGLGLGAMFVGSVVVGCGGPSRKEVGAPLPADLPELLTVRAQRATIGLTGGRLREDVKVESIQITRYPITQRQYERCKVAGACLRQPADCGAGAAGAELENAPESEADTPAVCVGNDQARAYCAWIGARLPTAAEWLIAARGREPSPFAWGPRRATCAEHGAGRLTLEQGRERGLSDATLESIIAGESPVPCISDPQSRLRLGQHPAGARPHGLEDVLITAAELIAPSETTIFAACRAPRSACLVRSHRSPGSIDAFVPWLSRERREATEKADDGDEGAASNPEYGFRCVKQEVKP